MCIAKKGRDQGSCDDSQAGQGGNYPNQNFGKIKNFSERSFERGFQRGLEVLKKQKW